MVSELEAKIRELDDTSKPVEHMAKELVLALDSSLFTIRNILTAKRKNFKSIKDFRDNWAKQNNFDSYSQYAYFRREENKKTGYFNVGTGQAKFENALEIIEPDAFERFEYFDRSESRIIEEEAKSNLKKFLGILSKKEKYVITQYFYEERTLANIGKELKLTKERIRQIKEEAIEKIRNRYASRLEVA